MDLPPLRARLDDINVLAEHFVDLACRRWNLPSLPFSSSALKKLRSHHWPGNVRELRNCIDRAILLCTGKSQIEADHILIAHSPAVDANSTRLDQLEYRHIMHVLSQVGGNKARAAALLGIERSTLLRKLQRFFPRDTRAE